MRVVVTGGAGFIGSNLVRELVTEGHVVTVIDDLSAGKRDNLEGLDVAVEIRDVRNIDDFSHILEGVDVVYHQAASKKNVCLKDPAKDMEVNGIGTLKLVQACIAKGVPKFIHASTGSVYGEVKGQITEKTSRNPVSYYGISKTAGESYVSLLEEKFKLPPTILRYFHVYGPKQDPDPKLGGVIPIFIRKMLRGEPIRIFGDGNQSRSFTYVEDVVRINVLAPVGVFNCASGIRVTINEMVTLLAELMDIQPKIEYHPSLEGDIYNFEIDNAAILAATKELTGVAYPFTPFEDGLRKTVAWYTDMYGRVML